MMKFQKFILISIFLLIIFQVVNAQHLLSSNLVPNPGFEDYTTCPNNGDLMYLAYPWTDANAGSTDYLNNCSVFNYIIDILQNNQPLYGNGCVGIFLYLAPDIYGNSNYREYIEVKLKNKLINHRKYCIYYNTVLSKDFGISIENIDLYLSHSYITPNSSILPFCYVIDSLPQIKNNNGIIIDNINWTKISGLYLSNGDEEYLTIGNFKYDNFTNLFIDTTKLHYRSSFYLIDDVSVCECSFDINLGPDAKLCEGDNIILNPNLPNATYLWQDSSHAATYEVKQPGTYWVRAYVAEYGITISDTIVISGYSAHSRPPIPQQTVPL